MTAVTVSYLEDLRPRAEAVPLSHLSIEAGRVFLEDFAQGDRVLTRQFAQAAPWLEAAAKPIRERFGTGARISTCLLVDEHTPAVAAPGHPRPSEVMDIVSAAAGQAGFTIDYLAREAGCAIACERPHSGPGDRSRLADIVAGLIVEEAAVGGNGSRPPSAQTGWLSNGRRSPSVMALDAPRWEPPEEYGKSRHSVFVDVELWNLDSRRPHDERQYSASLLSAVWQLLRLGLLRDAGRAVAKPYRFAPGEAVPDQWPQLPSIIRLRADAAPFAAYQTLSILPSRHRAAEHAAEIIIDRLRRDDAILSQIIDRARAEPSPIALSDHPTDRISHVFFTEVQVPR